MYLTNTGEIEAGKLERVSKPRNTGTADYADLIWGRFGGLELPESVSFRSGCGRVDEQAVGCAAIATRQHGRRRSLGIPLSRFYGGLPLLVCCRRHYTKCCHLANGCDAVQYPRKDRGCPIGVGAAVCEPRRFKMRTENREVAHPRLPNGRFCSVEHISHHVVEFEQ